MTAENRSADAFAMTRVFDAPRELVFRAWNDPGHVAQWWGPNGFTATTHEMEMRPGGAWRFTMHGPDGVLRFASGVRQVRPGVPGIGPGVQAFREASGPRWLPGVSARVAMAVRRRR